MKKAFLLICITVLLGLTVSSAFAQSSINCDTDNNGALDVSCGGTNRTVAAASAQTPVGSPTKPSSTSAYLMQGLAGSITPTGSGKVLIIISGTIVEATGTAAGTGVQYQLSYGTSTAPANAAALTGTQVGTVQKYLNPTTVVAADVAVPFSIQAVVTGLTVGTAYWIDLAAESITTASYVGFSNVSISVIEQ